MYLEMESNIYGRMVYFVNWELMFGGSLGGELVLLGFRGSIFVSCFDFDFLEMLFL